MKIIKEKENKIDITKPNCLENYLESLGIKPENVSSFMDVPKESDLDDYNKLSDIDKGLKIMKEAVDNNWFIYLQPDCDVDGFSSAAIFYQYFKLINPNLRIGYQVHTGKEHGIDLSFIPPETKLVVIPDAGSMQFEEQQALLDKGMKVLILDHHEMPLVAEKSGLAIINNQSSPEFSNKSLSGSGVTFLFVQAYDCTYEQGAIWRRYMDLAALGIISDVMDTRTLGNNYIIYNGLHTIRNTLLQTLLQKQSFHIADISRPNKVDIAFYIAPIINGLIRSGTDEEKSIFFRAMRVNNSSEIIQSTTRGKEHEEVIYDYAVRSAVNAKSRQDSAKKRGSALLNSKIETLHLDDHKILAVPISGDELKKVPPSLTGLIAMELLHEYNKPTLVLRQNVDENDNIIYSGSLRSKEFYGLKSLLQFIADSHYANFVEGHDNAAGIAFSNSNLKSFIDYADGKLKNVDFSNDYIEVDYWFKNCASQQVLTPFAKATYLWGSGIPQPKFAFTFDMDSSEFSFIGANHDTIKFERNGVDFVMFKRPKIVEQLRNSIKDDITCVGRAQINSYNNGVQIIIDDIDIKPVEIESAMDLI